MSSFNTSSSSSSSSLASSVVGVARVYYMSCLTVISQMRTNLPLIHSKAWPNGNGNLGKPTMGIGGARSWWWDEALTSQMLALLEPAGRTPTFQNWFAHDDHKGTQFGHGMGNGYAMDCPLGSPGPFGSNKCQNRPGPPPPPPPPGPEYGFYCYNPWAYYMAMSNHLRINNDTSFLAQSATPISKRNISVEDALELIVLDFMEYLIPGTNLVDYGPDMDGFSPTYKHVMPGCSQGNNVWMLRDFATLRETQGRHADATKLRGLAANLSKESMELLYTSNTQGHGWFNVVHPTNETSKTNINSNNKNNSPTNSTEHNTTATNPTANNTTTNNVNSKKRTQSIGNTGDVTTNSTRVHTSASASSLPSSPATVVVYEMRHVVDFFSMTFGLCGLSDQPCDFDARTKEELGNWFRLESVTSNWIRATSPKCNCSNIKTVPYRTSSSTSPSASTVSAASSSASSSSSSEEPSWPGFTTCQADRPDHGTTGAYPSWPAFATEALCYVDGNCSSAYQIMESFASTTYEGPFGQANEVPQLQQAPYTPFNAESAFKPIQGVNRYVAIEGGSFFESILRGFFGYHPPLQWKSTRDPQAALDATLVREAVQGPRGFVGKLTNLQTPFGLATITSDATQGLSIKLQ
eukprot:m.184217 g.184217  ORF g.184217 m.184217 type:complete len:635 (+) comp32181_c5_seq16:689-2593(+)